eukprot:765560-Hanusia_phi.AAC.2
MVAVAAGHRHSLALAADGSVYAWGANLPGQLGDGSVESRWRPTCVLGSQGGEPIVRIAAGRAHSMALLRNGTVMAWGWDGFGQLGREEPQGAVLRPRAVLLPDEVQVREVAAGGTHSLALDRTGRVWGWGGNEWGQVGKGSVTRSSRPVVVLEGASRIAAGASHSLAIAEGALYAWGSNSNGELGDGTRLPRSSPTRSSLSHLRVLDVAAGRCCSLARVSPEEEFSEEEELIAPAWARSPREDNVTLFLAQLHPSSRSSRVIALHNVSSVPAVAIGKDNCGGCAVAFFRKPPRMLAELAYGSWREEGGAASFYLRSHERGGSHVNGRRVVRGRWRRVKEGDELCVGHNMTHVGLFRLRLVTTSWACHGERGSSENSDEPQVLSGASWENIATDRPSESADAGGRRAIPPG